MNHNDSSRFTNTSSSYHNTSSCKSKLFGDVTLQIIDDFLNPMNKAKIDTQTHKIKFLPTSDSFGLGIPDNDSDEDSIINSENNCQGRSKTPVDEYKYAVQLRKEFEEELQYPSMIDQSVITESVYHDDGNSVVGSQMSQIESVSTMNMSKEKKKRLMERLNVYSNIADINEEDVAESCIASDFNNNLDMNRKMNVLENLYHDRGDQNLKISEEEKRQRSYNEFCKVHQFLDQYDPKLPITKMRKQITEAIFSYKFVIIQGGTGTGKTTQVPQYILDHSVENKKYCKIIVTQPRRLAATSISRRVCNERRWKLGMECGYQIGLDRSNVNEDTLITFVTTGVLLQKLIGEKADDNFNNKYTHIILDEVHERDLETDFILLLIKLKSMQKLKANIIIMSATMNTNLFSEYFKKSTISQTDKIPYIITIDSHTYKVTEKYWDDLITEDEIFAIEPTKNFRHRLLNQSSKLLGSKYLFGNSRTKNEYIHFENENQIIRELKSRIIKKTFDYDNPEMSEEQIIMTINLLRKFDHIDIDETNVRYKKYLDEKKMNGDVVTRDDEEMAPPDRMSGYRIADGMAEERGTVLIFVPGMLQIQKLQEAICHEFDDSKKFIIYPLHSDIVIDQQVRVFRKPKEFQRKIIISTGIAESSITIPDIKYVIDFCLTKELYSDPNTNYSHLRLEWASKSSLKQRRGRAGRVSDGRCYRLITKNFYKDLNPLADPAILREPLEQVILNLKRLDQVGEPKRILSMAIQPPKLSGIENTILLLKEVGALSLKCKNSKYSSNNASDGDLTYVGRIMANLPIDVRLSKLILLGHTFGKLKEAIVIAAGLSKKTVFTCFYKSYLESFNSKWIYSQGWMCDCLCILNAFTIYENCILKNEFKDNNAQIKWARQNNIEIGRMKEVYKLYEELKNRLIALNIKSTEHIQLRDERSPALEPNEYDIDDRDDVVSKNLILKMIIAGAFYPNYFKSDPIDIQEAVKVTGGHNILNTVQIKNLPIDEGILYNQKIEQIFSPCANIITIHFDGGKAYLEFKSKHAEIDSNVNIGVYRAVQMRLLRLPRALKRYNAAITAQRSRYFKKLSFNSSDNLMKINVSMDEINKGALKFDKLDLNQKSILVNQSHNDLNFLIKDAEDDDADEDARTIVDDDETYQSSDDEFINPKGKNNSRPNIYSSASLSNRTEKSFKDKKANTSISSLNNSLSSSRLTPCNQDYLQHLHLSNPKYILPPKVDEGKMLKIVITEVVTCAHFYAQISDDQHEIVLQSIIEKLNSKNYPRKALSAHEIKNDTLCCAYYCDPLDQQDCYGFYRAKILHFDRKNNFIEIEYVDFGNKDKKKPGELYFLTDDLLNYPFQAIECKLYNIKPNIFKNPNGVWCDRINKKFKEKVNDINYNYEIKIETIDSNIAFVSLYGNGVTNDKKIDFKEYLKKEGYAEELPGYRSESSQNLSLYSSRETLYIPKRQSELISNVPKHVPHNSSYSNIMNFSSTRNQSINRFYYEEEDLANITGSDFNEQEEEEEDERLFFGEIEIKGPYSPLEVTYNSLANSGSNKKVRAERESINYACIDDDPYSNCGRFMIGVDISLSSNTECILLRKTTLMPKLHGIASICCLMFCPTMELRLDHTRSRYTGALCGLGYDHESGAIHSENDIEIAFDVEIDFHDLSMINGLRMAVNLVIGSEEDVHTWTSDERSLRKLQQKACNKMLKVINRVRTPVEPKYYRKPYKWNQIKSSVIQPMDNNDDNIPSSASSIINTEELYYSYLKCVALNSSYDSN